MCDTLPPPVIVEETLEKCPERKTEQTPMEELDEALKACKFGRFHIRLLFSVLVRNIAGALASSTTPYLLISAECDLNMSLLQKGVLNSITFLGMCISTLVAGFLTDAFGRKVFVTTGLGGSYIIMLISGSSQTYEMLVTAKFLEGVIQSMSHIAAVTMTAELSYKGIRDRMMLCQFSCASLSQIAIAAMSWGLLIQDWKYSFFDGRIVLNTWNFYLIIMAHWALIACTMYLFIPESPKFLLTQHKYAEVREILINIYKENTGKSADTYQYANLWKDKPKLEKVKETRSGGLFRHLVVGLHNVKPMFERPLGLYLSMLCTINLLIMAVYNVVRLWFPQLSTIVEHYEDSGDLCVILDTYTSDLKTRVLNNTEPTTCMKSGNETYVNTIIIFCVCFLPYCVNGIIVNKVGKKALIIAFGVISVGLTLGSRFASSRIAVVSLFSSNVAVLQSLISLVLASAIELFPTTMRSLATSCTMMVGRFGTLIGNVSFPILLNMGCVVPFYTMTGIIASVVIMSFFVPSKK